MLTISNASVGFGNQKKALDNINLVVNPGEFIIVIGSNGAGKSTLLNLISGDLMPDSGSVSLNNIDVTAWPSFKRAALVAKVMQNPAAATISSLTIAENLAFALLRGQKRGFCISNRRARRQLFAEKLKVLELGLESRLDTLVSDLSGGQRQALSLVMATLSGSQVLLLDEHTAALDPKTAATVMDMTDRLVRSNGLTALMITHNMADAKNYGDRTLILEGGRISRH
ncbi:MAG: ATP-binding cassette domain-containing protein [Myxococcaceae bacterium]